jgi:putative transcriptional regulator
VLSCGCKDFFTSGGDNTKNSIRDLRERAGLTQDELARQLKVTRQTVNAIENDRYNPTLELAFRLANVFGTRIEDVFNWKGEDKR